MMDDTRTRRIVAVCGSLRETSKTRIALREALEAGRTAGALTELVDLRSYELPHLHAEDSVRDAESLRRTIRRADSVLLGTPNYHGSYSGALKNALDYCSREEFEGTTVGLLEVAAGNFPGPALHHLRAVCRTLNAWTLPVEVAIPNSNATVTTDGIADDEITERVRQLGTDLARYAGVENYPETVEQSEPTTGC